MWIRQQYTNTQQYEKDTQQMVDFKSLKKNTSSLDRLTKAIADSSRQAYSKDDERFWQPETDKVGNGYSVVRLLDAPAVDGEDALPWVQVFNHGFQGPAGWYIENCPTTVGGKCPACEHNSKLWNSGIDANKDIVSKFQKRRLTYIANVLILSDGSRTENVGKVFLWKFGKKIFDKINEKLTPQFQDEKALNPFDFWNGANLKIKIRQVEGYRNYDKSEFEAPSPVLNGDDKEIEKLWKSLHSLKQFVAPDQFKSYNELSEKLARALGSVGAARAATPIADESAPPWSEATTAAPVRPRKTAEDITVNAGEDDMSYFDKLAAG
jgi:gp32 DNA binding protein like